jgi:hypothetical protein
VTRASWFEVLKHFGRSDLIVLANATTPERDFPPLSPKELAAIDEANAKFHAEETRKAKERDEKINAANGSQDAADNDDAHIWTLQEICDQWCYVRDSKAFVCLTDFERRLDKQGFDDAFADIPRGKARTLSKLLLGNKKTLTKVDRMVYKPGRRMFLEHRSLLNLYRPSDIVPAKGDTTLWNAHLAYLFPDKADRDLVLNWCGWLLQHLDLKPKHALLVAGRAEGTGKTFISRVITHILGKHNVEPVGPSDLDSQFNEYALKSKLILIEELDALEKANVAKKLHPMVTEERIKVNDKNVKRINIDNCFGIFAMTNEDAAIPLKNKDRRWLVVRTEAKPKPYDYYTPLYGTDGVGGLVRDDKAIAAVAWELLHRDLGKYNGADRAPATTAKASMVEAGMTDLERWLHSQIGNYPFNLDLIQIDDVLSVMPARFTRTGMNVTRTITPFLKHTLQGYDFPNQHYLKNGDRVRLWAINGSAERLKDLTTAQRARLYEQQEKPAPNPSDFE